MGCLSPERLACLDESSKECFGERGQLRRNAEQICRRLDWLDKPERLLLEMIYEQGLSIRKTAVILQRSPSTVARRIRSLVRGLFSPEYQMCLHCRSRLTGLQMNIARQYYVQQKSRRQIARSCRISLYAVERQLKQVARVIGNAELFTAEAKKLSAREGVQAWCG